MATAQLSSVLQHLRTMAHARIYEDTSDRELLERFLVQREEPAFVAMLKRHGPMVLQVCRRIQGNEHDAEDTFQATFLLLARKAGSIRKLDSVASWLHGVAHRLALEAKTQEARRQMRERRAADMRNTSETADSSWQDLRGTLDEALRQLPEKYRTPLLLCYLEGKSHEEVARQLSCPIGTVHSRLARGRSRLKAVLERQGVCLSATALAAALAGNGMSATLPSLLFRATARAALAYSAGTAADVLVSARAAALLGTALDATLTAKLKMTIAVILALGAFGLGAGAAATHMSADPSHASAEATPPRSNATEDARPAPRKPASSPSTEAHQQAADPGDGEPAVVLGRVLDPDGKPVADAKVSYRQERFNHEPEGFYPGPVTAAAGSDGRFRFSATIRTRTDPSTAIGTLTASAPGFGPAAIHVGGYDQLKDFTLRLAKDDVPIDGRIIGLEGKPVAGVTVRMLTIRTNRSGDLQPWLDAIRDNSDGAEDAYLGILFAASQAGLNQKAVTDADGRFQLTGAGRDRIVALWLDGPAIESQFLFVMTRPGKTFRVGNKRHWPAADGPDLIHGARFEHAAAPATPVEGIVRDQDTGKPIAGATVSCRIPVPFGWDVQRVTATTDGDGRYRLLGRPRQSPYWIPAQPPAGQPYLSVMQLPPEAAPGQSAKLDFGLKRGLLIRGRVTDKATGKPLQAEVGYYPLADNPFLRGVERFPALKPIRNRKDGSFTLVGLPGPGIVAAKLWDSSRGSYIAGPGAERLKGYDPKLDGFASKGENVYARKYHALAGIEPGETSEVVSCDLQFDPGKTVTGACTGPDGQPLVGVTIQDGQASVGVTIHDKDLPTPQFTLHALNPEELHPFFFRHREKKLAAAVLLKGDEPEGFTVRLQPAAAATGRLIDEDGLPLVETGIRGEIKRGPFSPRGDHRFFLGKTDKDGRFRIEGLIPGIKVGAHIDLSKPINNSLIGELVFDQLTFQPGEVRDLGDIRVKTDLR